MELKLGAAIKKLRINKGIKQEELANFIGVSFQAVSKWETDTTMPDISLLLKLAVFFGVRIDDLFSINSEDELCRIDYMLDYENLTDDSFLYAKRTLDAILSNNENDTSVLKRYARLYLNKNNRDNLTAGRMLEKAISLSPLDEELYRLYRQVRGGDNYSTRSGNDWFIRFCAPYADKYPSNIKLYKLLIDAMIEMHYFDRAQNMIEHLKKQDTSNMCEIFNGDIEFAKGNIEAAKTIWSSVDKTDSSAQYEIGERFNRICEYEQAIECFENAFTTATFPRVLSSTYSLAFLYTKLGKYQKANNMWQRIIDVQESDWGLTEGTQVDWPRNEIVKLKEKLV